MLFVGLGVIYRAQCCLWGLVLLIGHSSCSASSATSSRNGKTGAHPYTHMFKARDHTHVCTHVCMHVCTHVYTHVCTHVCTHVNAHAPYALCHMSVHQGLRIVGMSVYEPATDSMRKTTKRDALLRYRSARFQYRHRRRHVDPTPASPTACLLHEYRRASTPNDRVGEFQRYTAHAQCAHMHMSIRMSVRMSVTCHVHEKNDQGGCTAAAQVRHSSCRSILVFTAY